MSINFVDDIKNNIELFIKENIYKFFKIRKVEQNISKISKGNENKDQYKCEKWLTTELYFRFYEIYDTVVPEYPTIKYHDTNNKKEKKYKPDLYIENKKNCIKNCIILEAKERYNGGDNSKYYNELGSTIEKIEKAKNLGCKNFLFFSTYYEGINKNHLYEIIKNKYTTISHNQIKNPIEITINNNTKITIYYEERRIPMRIREEYKYPDIYLHFYNIYRS